MKKAEQSPALLVTKHDLTRPKFPVLNLCADMWV